MLGDNVLRQISSYNQEDFVIQIEFKTKSTIRGIMCRLEIKKDLSHGADQAFVRLRTKIKTDLEDLMPDTTEWFVPRIGGRGMSIQMVHMTFISRIRERIRSYRIAEPLIDDTNKTKTGVFSEFCTFLSYRIIRPETGIAKDYNINNEKPLRF